VKQQNKNSKQDGGRRLPLLPHKGVPHMHH
jgi:hypothetical protein